MMDFSFIAVQFIKSIFLPPLLLILLVILAIKFLPRRPARAKKLLIAFVVCFWVASTPLTSQLLFSLEESSPALTSQDIDNAHAQAIIVLGGGMHNNAPEMGGETTSVFTLARLRYGARLHRQTGLPMLVTGAAPIDTNSKGEAQLMAQTLEEDFGIKPTWIEAHSLNTAGNAKLSKEILNKEGIDKIFLVTQAWHMRRAAAIFRAQGFEVIPAPTLFEGYTSRIPFIYQIIPTPQALKESYYAFHEFIGYLWYQIRY